MIVNKGSCLLLSLWLEFGVFFAFASKKTCNPRLKTGLEITQYEIRFTKSVVNFVLQTTINKQPATVQKQSIENDIPP